MFLASLQQQFAIVAGELSPATCQIPEGWQPEVRALCAALCTLEPPPVLLALECAHGRLGVRLRGTSAAAEDLIHAARQRLYGVCELTGAPGTLVTLPGGLLRVLCAAEAPAGRPALTGLLAPARAGRAA